MVQDVGPYNKLTNPIRSQAEILQRKMRNLGIPEEKAHRLEEQLDKGRIVVIAWNNKGDTSNIQEDSTVVYHPAALS
mgnify:CR=1 FL=1